MKYIVTLVLIYLLGAALESKTGGAGAAFQVSGTAQAQALYGPPANADAVANRRMFAPSYQGPQSLTPAFPWRVVLSLTLAIAGIVVIIMRLARTSISSKKMCANNVSIAPWAGFWFDIMSFIRCNVILLFSLIWVGFIGINIYVKLLLLCVSFGLDRIAVRKAEDVAIKTVDDFGRYAERYLTEEAPSRKVRLNKKFARYCFIVLCMLALTEILIHISGVPSNAAEQRVNIMIYEIAGVTYFYIVSAHFLGAIITNEKLKYADAWPHHKLQFDQRVVLTWRWITAFIFIGYLVMALLFLGAINKAENTSWLFDCVKYGAGFFLLATVLNLYATLPMTFKGAAYAHYLGQIAKT
jgi:hypothetical protein